MAERLGIVLYWTCCIIAGFLVAVVMLNTWRGFTDVDTLIFTFLPALLIWLLGFALRYILAGK